MSPDFSIVLVRPEIPHNTGAVGRLCVGLGVKLHLIRPLGFHLDDQSVARAGLDYWPYLDLEVHDTWQEYLAADFQFLGVTAAFGQLKGDAAYGAHIGRHVVALLTVAAR